MNDHDQRTCCIPGCTYCGGSSEILRASQAEPEHKAMLDAAMRLRPQVLSKAREFGMAAGTTGEGYMCYRTYERSEHHFAIATYDVLGDPDGKPVEVHLSVMHGRDSSSPGIIRMGTTLDWLEPCGCGRWEMPTDEQTDAMKRKVAAMGSREAAKAQRRALFKKRPS